MFGKKSKQRQPAKCVIRIDGKEIVDFYPYLEEVSVETSRKAAAVCTLTFASVRNEKGMWNIQDSPLFKPWNKITVEAFFGTHEEEIMRGFIRDIEASYPDDMNAVVTVTGQDESILLDRENVQETFSTLAQPIMDDALIRDLLNTHWNGSQMDIATGKTCGALYFNGTPIQLIRDRTDLNGYEFYIRKGKAYFGPWNLTDDPQSVILIYAGMASNCLNFSVFHDGHRPDSVSFIEASESPDELTEMICNSSYPLLGLTPTTSKNQGLNDFTWRIQQPRGSTLAEREARAQAKAEEAAWKIHATGELDGAAYGHVLETNRTVKVDGVGDTYGGLWYVDEVRHLFSANGYRQAFQLIRNATGNKDSAGKADPLAQVRV